jgi:hypothetical protein
MQTLVPSVMRLAKVKMPDVAFQTAWSVVAPPPRRVWMKGGLTQESLVREVMKGVLTLGGVSKV